MNRLVCLSNNIVSVMKVRGRCYKTDELLAAAAAAASVCVCVYICV